MQSLIACWEQTQADTPSLNVQAGSKCVVLAGLQYTLSLAPDKTVKHADRFPILAVCQAGFLDMWTTLEEEWEAVLGNDKKIDPSLLFTLFLFVLKNNHFELLLVTYYASMGVVHFNSIWKSPFFLLPMIGDQAQT